MQFIPTTIIGVLAAAGSKRRRDHPDDADRDALRRGRGGDDREDAAAILPNERTDTPTPDGRHPQTRCR